MNTLLTPGVGFVVIFLSLTTARGQPFYEVNHTLGSTCLRCWSSWADYDDDGEADVLVSDWTDVNTEGTRLYRNDGNGLFRLVALPPTRYTYDGYQAFWGDDNRDGRLDILISASDETGQPQTQVFHQLPDHSFSGPDVRLPGAPSLWADLDNDGDLDILASTASFPGTCWLHLSDGRGGYVQATPSFGTYLKSVGALDLDSDGDLDLLIRTSPAGTARHYRNEGRARFTESGIELPARATVQAMWVDVDGDSDLDMVHAGVGPGYGYLEPKILRNEGDGLLFSDSRPELPSSSGGTLRWADFDGDGHFDVLMNTATERIAVVGARARLFFNDATDHFTESTIQLPQFAGGNTEVMDLNNDGAVDFMVAVGAGEGVSSWEIYRNGHGSSGSNPMPPTGLAATVAGSRALLQWSAPTGLVSGFSFAVRVGTQPGAADIVSPLASQTGRRFIAGLGNAQASRRYYLADLAPGTYYWSAQSVDSAFRGSAFAAESTFVVPAIPSLPPAPTISEIPHQFTDEDVALPKINFVIGPAESVSNLVVTVEPGSPALTPLTALTLGGEGTNRWLVIAPETNQNGSSLITVRVTDLAGQSAASSFLLTVSPVNDAPFFDPIPNQVTYQNSKPLRVYFQVTDPDTNTLQSTAVSSNPELIPIPTVYVSPIPGSTNSAVTVTPQTNRTGSAVITLTLSDGLSEASAAFVVTVLPPPFVATPDRLTPFSGPYAASAGWADFDGDGDLDLLLAGYASHGWDPNVRYYRNGGAGQMVPGLSLTNQASGSAGIDSLLDYDRDGDIDAVLMGSGAGAAVMRNEGTEAFKLFSNVPGLSQILNLGAVTAWGDVDNDGDLDVAYCVSSTRQMGILFNHGWSFLVSPTLPNVSGNICLGDYDGDAVLDFAFSAITASGTITNGILRGLGDGKFAESNIILDQSTAGAVGFSDLDGDGILDFWQIGFWNVKGGLFLYRGLGDGQLAPPEVTPFSPIYYPNLRWADFDGDGDLDFVFGSSSPGYPLGFCRNEGRLQFTRIGDTVPNIEASYFGIADVDRDGDVDLSGVVSEATTKSVRVLTNQLSRANSPPGAPTALSAEVEGQAVWLRWQPANDFSQPKGLTYNVRVGTRPGLNDVVASMSLLSGSRLLMGFGNAGVRTNLYLTNLVGETFYWSVQAVDNSYVGGPFATERSFVVNLPGNQPPGIEGITDQTIQEDTALTLAFSVSDDRTPVEKLKLRAYATDPYLVAPSAIRFDGVGTNRTLTLLPATNRYGQTLVFVEATDAVGATATRSFALTVSNLNDAPVILPITAQTNLYSTEPMVVNFSVDDPDAPDAQLELTATSSNDELVPAATLIFSGASTNRFLTIPAKPPFLGETTITITARDAEGANSSASFLLVLHNCAFRLIPTPFGGVRSGSLAWGDYDNDGDLDLAVTGQGLNEAGLYRNDGTNGFTQVSANLPNVDGGGVEWGDYDNDGDLDLLIHGRGLPSGALLFRVYMNFGSGRFESVTTNLVARYGPAAWGDFDNDGDLDIVSSGTDVEGQYNAVVYRNEGTSKFVAVSTNSTIGAPRWEDVDLDGTLDLLLLRYSGGWSDRLCRGDGSGIFTMTSPPWAGSLQAWTDFNNDGRPDLLESTGTRQSLRVLRSLGHSFTPWGGDIQSNFTPDSEAVGDFDNDGFPDVLSTGYEGDFLYITRLFRSRGDGTWELADEPLLDFKFGTASWADIDNDGDLDLVVDGQRDQPPRQGYSTLLYRNDQQHSNSPPSAPSALQTSFTTDSATLFWQPAFDREQTNGLTYNVRIGSTPGGSDVLSPMSASNGFRLIPKPGNAGWQTRKVVRALQRGQTYYWSVQSVDSSYAGSAFASEVALMLGEVPVLSEVPDQVMDEDTELDVTIVVFDPDGNVDAVSINVQASNTNLIPAASIAVSGMGTNRLLRIVPARDQSGTTIVELTAVDAQGGQSVRAFGLTVRPVNDTPSVQDQLVTLAEDTVRQFTVEATDPDGDPLRFSTVRQPFHGSLSGTGPLYTYRPHTNYFGSDACEFQISDNHGASDLARITFNVSPVEDGPGFRLLVRFLSDGSAFLTLIGDAYQLYGIETSPDLYNWSMVGTFWAVDGRIEFVGEPAAAGTARFYRARLP